MQNVAHFSVRREIGDAENGNPSFFGFNLGFRNGTKDTHVV